MAPPPPRPAPQTFRERLGALRNLPPFMALVWRTSPALTIAQAAESLGGWTPLSEDHVFDVEYWSLEQAKLGAAGSRRRYDGEIAVVTGAASGIGRACAEALLVEGAAVVGLDLERCPTKSEAFHAVVGDVRSSAAVEAALDAAAARFGGLDVLVLNAGIFPPSTPIAELDV